MREIFDLNETLQTDNLVQVRFITEDGGFVGTFLTENALEMYMFLKYLKTNCETIAGLEMDSCIDRDNYTEYTIDDVLFIFDKTVGEDACRPTIRVVVSE